MEFNIDQKDYNFDRFNVALNCYFDIDPKSQKLFEPKPIHKINYYSFFNPFPECAICLLSPISPSKIRPCNHIFCYRCISEWKKFSNKCPLCRGPIAGIFKYY